MKRRRLPLMLGFVVGVMSVVSLLPAIASAQVVERWVARYSGPTGVFPGPADDKACCIARDPTSGHVYVTGRSYGGIGYGGPATGDDYATVAYDANGIQLWVARYDRPHQQCPPPHWCGGNERPTAIAVDPHSGTVYVTGYSSSGWPYISTEYATVAYDALGNQLWVARYDGRYDGSAHAAHASAIAVDPNSGTVYVTGSSYGGTATSYDYATVAYDASGDQLWVARYDGPGHSDDRAWAIAVDPNSGAVYVTGESYPGGYATVAYDAGGNQLWVARYEGPVGIDYVHGIALDPTSGNVYVTGQSSRGAATGADYATVAYDACGNQLWVARYGDGSAHAIALDPASGNVYVTGSSYGGAATRSDYATVAYDACGNQRWVARYDGAGDSDGANAIALDPTSGNLYVTGISYTRATGYDYATVAYDASGRQLWVARHHGGPTGYETNAVAIAVGSGDVYVTGYDYGREGGGTTSYATVAYSTSEMVDSPEVSPMGEPQEVRRPRCHACCSNGSGSSDETTSETARAIRWCGRMYKRLLKIESRKDAQHQVDLDEVLTGEVEQHQP